jgi:hypothetical protein
MKRRRKNSRQPRRLFVLALSARVDAVMQTGLLYRPRTLGRPIFFRISWSAIRLDVQAGCTGHTVLAKVLNINGAGSAKTNQPRFRLWDCHERHPVMLADGRAE